MAKEKRARVVAQVMSWGGEAAIIYGVYQLFGLGVALIVGGALMAGMGLIAVRIIADK